jgi:hypothetical protein
MQAPHTRGRTGPRQASPLAVIPPVAGSPETVVALPQIVDLDIYQGDDLYIDLVVTNNDGSIPDLTPYTPSAQIRPVPDSPTLLAAFDCTVDGNTVHLHLPGGAASNLNPGVNAWDCQIESADPNIFTLVYGTVTVTGQVTLG